MGCAALRRPLAHCPTTLATRPGLGARREAASERPRGAAAVGWLSHCKKSRFGSLACRRGPPQVTACPVPELRHASVALLRLGPSAAGQRGPLPLLVAECFL